MLFVNVVVTVFNACDDTLMSKVHFGSPKCETKLG